MRRFLTARVKENGGWRAAAILKTATPKCARRPTAMATRCFGLDCRSRKFPPHETFPRLNTILLRNRALLRALSWWLRNRIEEAEMGKGLLLWLVGVPIPVIILLWLFFGR